MTASSGARANRGASKKQIPINLISYYIGKKTFLIAERQKQIPVNPSHP